MLRVLLNALRATDPARRGLGSVLALLVALGGGAAAHGSKAPAPREIAVVATRERRFAEAAIDIARRFYGRFPDRYETLVVWVDERLRLPSGFYWPLGDGVRGIGNAARGAEATTFRRALGRRRLVGIVWLPAALAGSPDVVLRMLAHETAHRWGAAVRYRDARGTSNDDLVGRPGHWSFFLDTGASPLGGNRWEPVGPGRWRALPVERDRYSALDLYLMGLLAAEDVPPLTLLRLRDGRDCRTTVVRGDLPADPLDGSPRSCAALPRVTQPVTIEADVETVSIRQVIAVQGPRVPVAQAAPRSFRQAWLYAHAEGVAPAAGRLVALDDLRRSWGVLFRQATGGRGEMITDLGPD